MWFFQFMWLSIFKTGIFVFTVSSIYFSLSPMCNVDCNGGHWFPHASGCSSYHVSETGLWWQELASDLNNPKDIYCSPKEEKDATVFSVRVCSTLRSMSAVCSFCSFAEVTFQLKDSVYSLQAQISWCRYSKIEFCVLKFS